MGKVARSAPRIETLRRKARAGNRMAASNLAAEYRILGKGRRAFRRRAKGAEPGEGGGADAGGGGNQHGMGVRRDIRAAARWYEAASRSRNVTPYGREEARYLLAVLMFAMGHNRHRRRATGLLQAAAAAADYPQARALLAAIQSNSAVRPCFCR